jgi:serine/threonine protein phosphatase PrpC
MRFESVSRTDVGLKRKINEDSVLAAPDRALWAVADGMGGHDAGEVASAMVVEALQALPDSDDLDATVSAAIEALEGVNQELIRLARTQSSDRTIGTTIVGLAIADGAYRCFWAGDSRAYRLRNGEIARISRDHSLVQDLIDAGMLTPEEAERHENANVITRAVGVAEDIRVEVVSGDVMPGDQFVLASDGLTRVVNDGELAAELMRNPPDRAANVLIETVLRRGAPDNVSLVIAKVV